MKKILIKSGWALAAIVTLLSACSKFEEINKSPKEADASQVQVEYFINNSIIGAQMDPNIAERSFVLYWKTASRQHLSGGLSSGNPNDDWSTEYYRYSSTWLNHINTAIQIADEKIKTGDIKPYTENLRQVARIWRAYLMSELSDNFGPIPIKAFDGGNPDFAGVKEVYYYILDELKDASAKLNTTIQPTDDLKLLDPAYGYDFAKWKKYANSMRLRLAMRLSEVDGGKARAEFEDAVKGELIDDASATFQVQEKGGWDALSGVMSREWNAQILSTTLENIYTGLGGVKTADQLGAAYQSYIKPADWAGLQLKDHFSTMTNDPFAGFWFDGLPQTIDPRAYKAFIPAGDFTNANFSRFPSYDQPTWETTARDLVNEAGGVVKTLEGKFTWNGSNAGDWGAKGTKNKWYGFPGSSPRLGQQFRNSANKRIFFHAWETNFLIAEAAVRGWTVPVSGKAAYEKAISQSFEYWGVSGFLSTYLASTDFNRTGTSVSWDHTAEPPATHLMNFKDGYSGAAGTVAINYPVNNLYKNGTVKNDLLTKIITQKYIAQVPWLPLEGWNDKRRLGLPFFENPMIEQTLVTLPALNNTNYMTSNVNFFPQRLKYPSSLKNTNGKGYDQAVAALPGGGDAVLTPLWWAKKP
ncbi:SusD/RagB family nutrient-binding outer membrane lipoprotein [Chitinophaga arvensicola]|uniref:Susd and RagB outer membrane lipoprotein n=1 Tax=Chitinophaga arvensicola TaxID=29529 RepID=A0A1I0QYQ4_9BACT|nr:SusD/RagB family nutrient-binding outer membrane lipoprotein [Chitinophaga arvensicola]SEW32912.1 Susd and RagB outer membrane lipoprotein [Chitinophaga arvensicola]